MGGGARDGARASGGLREIWLGSAGQAGANGVATVHPGTPDKAPTKQGRRWHRTARPAASKGGMRLPPRAWTLRCGSRWNA